MELLPELNFFIVCQANGVIGFFDICSGDLISYFNEPTYSPDLYRLFSDQYEHTLAEKRKHNKEKRKIENFTDTESEDEAVGEHGDTIKMGLENESSRHVPGSFRG